MTIHGIGLQWHINVSTMINPGDEHYQSAQHFIDNKLDIMVTEFDVAIRTNGIYPVDPADLQKQGLVYLSMLEYVLHFSPNCRAFLSWGFTDRYSSIPVISNFTRGDALPLDWMYLPKPAYWQMQEKLARVLLNGIYRISPQSQPDKCLGTSSGSVRLYSGDCNELNQKWNITWLGDGTYRLSSQSSRNQALTAFNTTASVGGVQIDTWSGDFDQEWALSNQGSNLFHMGPRKAWWRVMTIDESSNIDIIDPVKGELQSWILTNI